MMIPEGRKDGLLFMVDNGATVNLVKIGALDPNALVDTSRAIPLIGISDQTVETLGTISLTIRDKPVTFLVTYDNFPIDQDGVLGRNYLKQEKAVISYHYNTLMIGSDVMRPIAFISSSESPKPINICEVIVDDKLENTLNTDSGLPPSTTVEEITSADHILVENEPTPKPAPIRYTIPRRCRKVLKINVVNKGMREGYLPVLDVGYDDVYVGEGIVRVENDCCQVMAINTREDDVTIEVKPGELIPFEYAAMDFEPGSEDDVEVGANNPIVESYKRTQELKKIISTDHLNAEEKDSVEKLISDYTKVFLLPGDPLPCTDVVEHFIPTDTNRPVNAKQYRHPVAHQEFIQKDIQKKLDEGIIEPSNSPSSSPIWIVPKRSDPQGKPRWRMVVDFRELNQRTVGDAYPLPNIADLLDQLGGAIYFSVFDLASGFHQIKMAPEDKWKIAFSTPGGHYEFNRMPMGLKNAPATFQRLMDQIKRGIDCKELLVYMDEVFIHAKTLEEHDRRVRKFFDRLAETKLVLQPEKVHFLKKEVSFLGHIISFKGIEPDPGKIHAVKNFPRPKIVRNVREFTGLTGYYRRFIKDYSKIAKPLYELQKKDKDFHRGPAQEEAFEILKDKLCNYPILIFPDFNKPFTLTTDASDGAIGVVLSQEKEDFDHPINYLSRTLNKAERNYSTTEKECLAVLYALNQFRPYLLGRKFTLIADHEPLNWMHNRKDPGQRLMR